MKEKDLSKRKMHPSGKFRLVYPVQAFDDNIHVFL